VSDVPVAFDRSFVHDGARLVYDVYGTGDRDLLGIGVQADVGWRVGWLGHPRRRRAAILAAASDLLRGLDVPEVDMPPTLPRAGAWFRSR